MQDFYNQLEALENQCEKSIVGVSNYSSGKQKEQYNEQGQITGTIIAKTKSNIMVLTNYSKLQADEVVVRFFDGTDIEGSLYGADTRADLAIVAVPLDNLSAKIKEPYKSWLEHTARRTAKRTDADFTEIWKGCVEKDLGAAGLKKEHREWIRDFGAFLGQGDRETMGRSIELSMKQMDLMIRQQRGELAGKRKIGNWLGVMSGLFLIILLW